MRKDGRCVVCKGPRKRPKVAQRGVDPIVYDRDPFCSSTCCREWYGTQLERAKPASANLSDGRRQAWKEGRIID